jgi:hypothetical protein
LKETKLIQKIRSLAFYLRKRVDGKYIVIESDDWGLERAKHDDAIDWTEKKYGIDKFSRWTTDALETKEDLHELFHVLKSFKDKFEKPPILTANFITHNVDRDSSGNLMYRPLSQNSHTLLKTYREGIVQNLIFPQFHGFSHFNTAALTEYNQTQECDEAYKHGFMLARTAIRGNLNFLQGEYSNQNIHAQEQFHLGMREFRNVFGFESTSFIPPTYIFDRKYFAILSDSSINYLQAGNRLFTSERDRYIFPVMRKKKGILWGIRNARLDVHPDYNFEYDQCISSIEMAFQQQLPAVIDFHRVNFSGRFRPDYRERTIKQMHLLFDSIHKRWPQAEFITSNQLIDKVYGA